MKIAFGCLLAMVGVVCLASALSAAVPPPNVLLLIGDDHATHVFGGYGSTLARTPNLDRLAASGTRFERAYCNSPVCTASRQSFLTGRLPHSIGVTLLRTPLGEGPVTLAELLKPFGYDTAALGKMHLNSDRTHGFDRLYDHAQINQEMRERPPLPLPEGVRAKPPWRPFKDRAAVWLNAEVLPLGRRREDMPSTRVTDQAVEFLREHAPADGRPANPFLLVVSLYEPHSPFDFPVELAGAFDPAAFEVPEVGPGDDDQIPAIFRGLTRAEKQGIIAAYHASAQFLDENMGRVLGALDETGLAANTVVVYLGDHGYSLGHHGRFEKHCSYEPAVRAPLVIRRPDGAGAVSGALVEFIDLFPTLAELCGAPLPPEVEGRSLVPLLGGKTDRHREAVFSEYLENEEAMVFDGRFKLVYSTGKRERQDGYATGRPAVRRNLRLYDHQADPDEFHNVAAQPQNAPIVARLKAEMMARFAQHPDWESSASHADSFEDRMDILLTPPEQ